MNPPQVDLAAIARQEMMARGFEPDIPAAAQQQAEGARQKEGAVAPEGALGTSPGTSRVYRALVRNRAQLTYGAVGPWLEGKAAMPAKVAASAPLAAQLQLQNEAAHLLRAARDRMGALTFDRAELQTVVDNGKVRSIEGRRANT